VQCRALAQEAVAESHDIEKILGEAKVNSVRVRQ
jgi:hypothetical protein